MELTKCQWKLQSWFIYILKLKSILNPFPFNILFIYISWMMNYNIAHLIFNRWDEHAAEFRKLDTVMFSDNERTRLGKTVSEKLNVHIEVMNYFIKLAFEIKSIIEKGA